MDEDDEDYEEALESTENWKWKQFHSLGCNSIDILNLRLELRLKLRQGLRTHLGGRWIGRWLRCGLRLGLRPSKNVY